MKLLKRFINLRSIRPQLFITVVLGILTLLIALIFASTWISNQHVRNLLIKQGKQVTLTLAKKSTLALLYDSPENADTIIRSTLEFPGITHILIYRSDKSIFYTSSDNINISENEKQRISIEILNPKTTLTSASKILNETKNTWKFIAPVLLQQNSQEMEEEIFNTSLTKAEKIIGYVIVISSKNSLHTISNGILISNSLIALFIGLLLIFILQKTIKRLTQPLYNISNIMKSTEEGNFSTSLNISGPSEIQTIIRSYNRMINALSDRDKKLKQQNISLEKQATRDHLTKIFNRIGFEQKLLEALEESKAQQTEHVLCYMDLDKFKIVNDSCGHNAGDKLLKNISDIFSQHIRKGSDILARVGGDEFALILKNCSIEKANFIGTDICNSINQYRFNWEGKVFSVGVSIGIAAITKSSGDIQKIISRADSACYVAKEKGRGQVHVFHSNDKDLQAHDGATQIASMISDSLDNDKFSLFYQPIQPLINSNKRTHFEVLLRMQDDNGKDIPPYKFLSSAERYDMLLDIDRWVISKTLEQLSELNNKTNRLNICSINISKQSIHDEHLISFIKEKIDIYKIHPQHICFDISETAAINNPTQTREFINNVRAIGCLIALDDFISGSVSFAYIKDTEIDFLKIDGKYFKDLSKQPINHAMIRSITEVAQILNIKTLAKNIEDKQALHDLQKIGIDYVQGFAIAKPMPFTELVRFMVNHHDE